MNCSTDGKDSYLVDVVVVVDEGKENKYIPILALKTCEKLRLIKKVHNFEIKSNYDIFDKVGLFPKEYEIQLNTNTEPKNNDIS